MSFLLYVFVAWLIYKVIKALVGGSNQSGSGPSSSPPPYTASPPPDTRPKHTYRPRSEGRAPNSNIDFRDATVRHGGPSAGPMSSKEFEGLRDAFTGEQLKPSKGLYRCGACHVFYHSASYDLLAAENGRRCVSCGNANLLLVTYEAAREQGGANFDPNLVTLATLRSYVGRVVTYEGYVYSVKQSRRGDDYAVMFENKSWARGFKLMFFQGAVGRVGGPQFIQSLTGRTVRVRGLLRDHPTFGLEILVSERSMILSVR